MAVFVNVRDQTIPIPVAGEFEIQCKEIVLELSRKQVTSISDILKKMDRMDIQIKRVDEGEVADIVAILKERVPDALANYRRELLD